MKVVSKGRIFGFTTEISDELLDRLGKQPEILQKANAAGATYWHSGILPQHFEASAHGKYHYATRASKYLKSRGKQGKPDLVFSGSMKQEMLSFLQVTATATGAQAKLRARVLNVVPNMAENDQNYYVRQTLKRGGTRPYPNLKREVKVILDDEREAVAEVVKQSYLQQMGQANTPPNV
jgi:hypothetical protein